MLFSFFAIFSLFELITTAWGWVDTNELFNSGEIERLSKIGDFQIVEFLGKGSQGSAYKVLDLHASNHTNYTNLTNLTNSIYALKLVSPNDLPIKVYETLQKARSPYLILVEEILDFKIENFDLKAVVMEYLPGKDLYTYLNSAEFKNLTQEVKTQNAFDYVKCIKVALDEMIGLKITHGDLMQTNIFLVDNDFSKCKIIDFDKSTIQSQVGLFLGSAVSPVYEILGMKVGRASKEILDKLYMATTPQEMLDILKANAGNFRRTAHPVAQPASLSAAQPTALLAVRSAARRASNPRWLSSLNN